MRTGKTHGKTFTVFFAIVIVIVFVLYVKQR